MIDAIVDGLLKGMGVAGWIIGLMAVLGIFLLVVGLFCYVMLLVFGGEDEEDGEEETVDRCGERTGATPQGGSAGSATLESGGFAQAGRACRRQWRDC